MNKTKKFRTLEEDILILQEEGKQSPLSIAEIFRVLSGKGRPLILILLCLPFCQPIQIPGFSIPFGFAVAFIGLRMSFGKKIWLPENILKKEIPSKTLISITEKALNVIKRIRPWVHPRLTWLCNSPFMEKSNGLMIFILGILLALPLPVPMSNLMAGWSILLIAFGVLEDDGVFVLAGYLVLLLTLTFFFALALSLKNYYS